MNKIRSFTDVSEAIIHPGKTISGENNFYIKRPSVTIATSGKIIQFPVIRDTAAKNYVSIQDLGWTLEKAKSVRDLFAFIAEDWDDPEMDVYDTL